MIVIGEPNDERGSWTNKLEHASHVLQFESTPIDDVCVCGGGGGGGGVRIVLALHSKANTISEINKPPLLQCSYQISEAFVVLLKTVFSHDILSVYYSFYSTTSCSMAQHLQH